MQNLNTQRRPRELSDWGKVEKPGPAQTPGQSSHPPGYTHWAEQQIQMNTLWLMEMTTALAVKFYMLWLLK